MRWRSIDMLAKIGGFNVVLIAPKLLVEHVRCAGDVGCRSLFQYGARAAVTNEKIVKASAVGHHDG